jgi:hypothetical protein
MKGKGTALMDKAGHHTMHLSRSEDLFTDFPLDVKFGNEEYTMTSPIRPLIILDMKFG